MSAPHPPQFEIVKAFPPRGEWRLFRLVSHSTFTCHRCGGEKKSKMVSFHKEDWENVHCNGCYGYVLSGRAAESSTDTGLAS